MHLNRHGMTAFMDAMVFLVIITMAVSAVVVSTDHTYHRDVDSEMFLDQLSVMEVRLSDLTPLEDDSLASISDIMAYSTAYDSDLDEYLVSLLDAVFGKGRYGITYSYGGVERMLGDAESYYDDACSITMSSSMGDSVNIELVTR